MKKSAINTFIITSLLVYFIFGAILAFTTPENILEKKWAQTLVETLSFIPYVKGIGLYSPIPQVAQFFAAFMYLCSLLPITVLLMTAKPQVNELGSKFKVGQFAKYGFVFYLVFPFLVLNAGVSAPSDTRLWLAETSSRLGLSILGSMHVFSALFLISGTLLGIYYWKYLAYGELKYSHAIINSK